MQPPDTEPKNSPASFTTSWLPTRPRRRSPRRHDRRERDAAALRAPRRGVAEHVVGVDRFAMPAMASARAAAREDEQREQRRAQAMRIVPARGARSARGRRT
jgi:hypothetical protein